jgi:hypothetical protein
VEAATGYFFDAMLAHRGVQMKFSEIIDVCGYGYFSEEKVTGHE